MFKNVIQSCRTSVPGFVISAALAVYEQWNLQEFCWSFWICGLLYCWCCVAAGCIRILLPSGRESLVRMLAEKDPLRFMQSVPQSAVLPAMACLSCIIGWLAFYAYSYLFSFYGIFLSVFAEMQPHSLFGRNGFINSDFFTPVVYLAQICWPMALGSVIADRAYLLRCNPWKLLLKPFSRQIAVIHIAVLTMPFVTLLCWMLFKEAYQPLTMIVLLAVFYFFPRKES